MPYDRYTRPLFLFLIHEHHPFWMLFQIGELTRNNKNVSKVRVEFGLNESKEVGRRLLQALTAELTRLTSEPVTVRFAENILCKYNRYKSSRSDLF